MIEGILFAACLIFPFAHGGGFLTNPKARSFNEYGRRSRLVNAFPCGGPTFMTASAPTLLVPIQAQQNQTSVDWFNTGLYVTGTLNFHLCTALPSACYTIKTIPTNKQTPLGAMTVDHISLPQTVLTNGECSYSKPCVLVMEWQMNKYETIYNCGDVYLSPYLQYAKAPTPQAPQALANNAKSGVPPNSCRLVNAKPNSVLAPVGDRCDAGWRGGQYRCGFGQCCTTFYEMSSQSNPPRFCSPIYLNQNGSSQATYLPRGPILDKILSETVLGTIFDPEVAMFAACQNVPTTYDYRFGAINSDAQEVCNLCNLPDPTKCTSSYMFAYSEQVNMNPTPVAPESKEGNGTASEDTVPVIILIVILALILIGVAVITYVLFKNNGFAARGYYSFSEETSGGGVSRIIRKTPQKKLPPGWKEYETDDGELYYYNEDDGTTQWEFPEV